MKTKFKKYFIGIIISIISLIILYLFCNLLYFQTHISKDNKLTIVRSPDSIVFRFGKLDSLKRYKGYYTKNWERDFVHYDPSNLDIRNSLEELLHSDFDSKTNWPHTLPVGFNPDSIMEIGKNPGLNIRKLHKEGITGKGIGIAIIDQNLLVDHCEYKDQLRMYEEIHIPKSETNSALHGPAVASIAVGKSVGVAPDADLYYISTSNWSLFSAIYFRFFKENKFLTSKWFVKSIYRILEINKALPQKNKIRVISISWQIHTKEFLEAVEDADKQGVFVISCSVSQTHNFRFNGLGKDCLDNPDDINSYHPGSWWSDSFYKNPNEYKIDSTLMVPMDFRCIASQSGINSYALYSDGGWSWSVPYIAGLYALACQVKPSITPKEFWNKALTTGDIIEIEKNHKRYRFGKIVNPVKLMGILKK